jgi:L-rhamnose mutarotase
MKSPLLMPLMILLFSLLFAGCRQKNLAANANNQMEEKVFVVNLRDDKQKLQEYLKYHEHVWPEVEAGFKKAGYKKIVLYRYVNLLVMTITVPENSDLNAMGKLAESYSPRCSEWNKLMSNYQTGVPGTKPGQTWVKAQPFYIFNNQ